MGSPLFQFELIMTHESVGNLHLPAGQARRLPYSEVHGEPLVWAAESGSTSSVTGVSSDEASTAMYGGVSQSKCISCKAWRIKRRSQNCTCWSHCAAAN